MFLLVSLLAGVLVAGLAIPGAALTGVMSSMVSTSLSELPSDLEDPPTAQITDVYMADGSLLAQFYDENRRIVTLAEIAPIMQKAQIAIEDDRFYAHGALDLKALVKAVITNIGGTGGGGSTLTQQYVKQAQIETAMSISKPEERKAAVAAAQERTLKRKIQEMRFAIAVEEKFSKDEILERYLNIAYYGDGAYGVEAAAHHYFNTTAANLTLAQAAMLAGIVQTPARNPGDPDEVDAAIERRNIVLDRMAELEIITDAEATEAKAEGYDPEQIQIQKNGCVGVKYSGICQLVQRYLQKNENIPGNDEADRLDTIRRGGYTIYTYIDPAKQDTAQAAVSNMIAAKDPVISTMVEMQPGTGIIFAAAQNRPFGVDADEGETWYLSFAPKEIGDDNGYQPGSTAKAFTTAAALELGVPPTKLINAKAPINFSGQPFKSCEPGTFPAPDGWNVINTSPSGVMDMYHAAANSVNTYYVLLEQMIGICPVVTVADAVGLTLSSTPVVFPTVMSYQKAPSFTLGTFNTSPFSMATAYSTFAAHGVRCDPVVIKSITDSEGNDVGTPDGNCHQAISADVADGVNAVLNNVFTYGTASGRGLPDGRPASGKSGTNENNDNTWFIGYTPEIVGVAMISIDTNPDLAEWWDQHGNTLARITLPESDTYLYGTGAADATRVWRAAMVEAVKDLPPTPFTRPPSYILNGKPAQIPTIPRGSTKDQVTKILEDANFFVQEKKVYDDSPAGTYVGYSCEKYYGGTCTLSISQGPRAPEPSATPSAGSTPAPGSAGNTVQPTTGPR